MSFAEKVAAEIADSESKMAADPASFEGYDWWQLSPEEEAVFAIDRERWPRMMTAWYAYEGFMNIVAPDELGFELAEAEREREERPDIFGRGVDEKGFSDFAVSYAGLTRRECAAVYAKQKFWTVRQGLLRYSDEP